MDTPGTEKKGQEGAGLGWWGSVTNIGVSFNNSGKSPQGGAEGPAAQAGSSKSGVGSGAGALAAGAGLLGAAGSSLMDALDWLRGKRAAKAPQEGELGKKTFREKCRDAWKSAKERIGNAYRGMKERAGQVTGAVSEKLRPSVDALSSKVAKHTEFLKPTKAAALGVAERVSKSAATDVAKSVVKKTGAKLAGKGIVQGLSWSGIGLPVAIIAGVGLAGYELYSLHKEGKLTWGNAAYAVASNTPYLGTALIANDVAEAVTGKNYVKNVAGAAYSAVTTRMPGLDVPGGAIPAPATPGHAVGRA